MPKRGGVLGFFLARGEASHRGGRGECYSDGGMQLSDQTPLLPPPAPPCHPPQGHAATDHTGPRRLSGTLCTRWALTPLYPSLSFSPCRSLRLVLNPFPYTIFCCCMYFCNFVISSPSSSSLSSLSFPSLLVLTERRLS